MNYILKWDKRFLELAKFISQWSKDPSTKVGAVITDQQNRIVSVGYNGFPQGIYDTEERLNNRETKYKMVIHAERNALIFAQKPLTGCTLYIYPFCSCSVCAAMFIQAGINRCVSLEPSEEIISRWGSDLELTRDMFKEAGVELIEYSNHRMPL